VFVEKTTDTDGVNNAHFGTVRHDVIEGTETILLKSQCPFRFVAGRKTEHFR